MPPVSAGPGFKSVQLRWLWKRSCGLTRLSAHGRTMPIVCPGLRDPRISPFSKCLSGEAVWDGHRQLDGVDGALVVWQMEGRWWVRVSRPGRCARGCGDKSALFAYGVVFRAACVCTSRGGSSLSSVFNRSRIHVFPLVPSLPFDKHELMPEARR